jgi:hypothetical protein
VVPFRNLQRLDLISSDIRVKRYSIFVEWSLAVDVELPLDWFVGSVLDGVFDFLRC